MSFTQVGTTNTSRQSSGSWKTSLQCLLHRWARPTHQDRVLGVGKHHCNVFYTGGHDQHIKTEFWELENITAMSFTQVGTTNTSRQSSGSWTTSLQCLLHRWARPTHQDRVLGVGQHHCNVFYTGGHDQHIKTEF